MSLHADYVATTSYIKKAFGTRSRVIKLQGLRRRIIGQMNASAEEFCMTKVPLHYNTPLWCLKKEDVEFVASILNLPVERVRVVICDEFCS